MSAGSEKPYWIAFNHISGIGAVRAGQLLKFFGSLEDAWKASGSDLLRSGIPEKITERIKKYLEK